MEKLNFSSEDALLYRNLNIFVGRIIVYFERRCDLKLGRIIGTVVATRKVENVKALKLLVVRYLNEKMEDTDSTAVCVDTVTAGVGDIVLLCSSSSARLTKLTHNVCTDNTIVGIVDSVSSYNKFIYKKGEDDL